MLVFILPNKIPKLRYANIKKNSSDIKLPWADKFGDSVSHIVTAFEKMDQVCHALRISQLPMNVEVVTLMWFVECMKARGIVPVRHEHRLTSHQILTEKQDTDNDADAVPKYACQRCTPLKHHNQQLSSALETLQLHAELSNTDRDYSRALAFRKASCLLKSLSYTVTRVSQVKHLHNMGDHILKVIKEILEERECREVANIQNDSWFNTMSAFTNVFGVGPATAKKWISERGWSTIEEARKHVETFTDWRIRLGLAFYDDLTTPVVKEEADYLLHLVKDEINKLEDGAIVELAGGFRRGKSSGHDVDILISHPNQGKELGLLNRLLSALTSADVIMQGVQEKNSYDSSFIANDRKTSTKAQTMDHFEKWLGIVKVPKSCHQSSSADEKALKHVEKAVVRSEIEESSSNEVDMINNKRDRSDSLKSASKRLKLSEFPRIVADCDREWVARRLDLIVCPYDQYYYALVGWTGNKQFNRELRTYSQRERNLRLTSHGLTNTTTGSTVSASSEKDVFERLGLTYIEPSDRNC